jgi:uncharacterized protein YdaU (DUF1376 family)
MTRSIDYRMDFYVKDFLTSTETMTGPEAAAYSLVLIHAWAHCASLPADPERIRRICRYDSRDWRRVWPALEPKLPLTLDDTARRNPRQVELWAEAEARVAKAHEHAKKGAAGRWGGDPPDDAPSNARALPEQCGPRLPSPSPSSEEKYPEGRGAVAPRTPPALEDVLSFAREDGIPEKSAERYYLHRSEQGWRGIKDFRPGLKKWAAEDAEKKTTPAGSHGTGDVFVGGAGTRERAEHLMRVVVHRNQRDLDTDDEVEQIQKNRDASTRSHDKEIEDDRILNEVLEEKRAKKAEAERAAP